MSSRLLSAACAALLAGCHPALLPQGKGAVPRGEVARDVDEVEGLLTGFFDSEAQAAADSNYLPIHLAICPVSAPGLGERVLYVEQARADALGAPYRQRLYVLEPVRGKGKGRGVRSRVFELSAPGALVGTCHRGDVRQVVLGPGEATEKSGCEVTLAPVAGGASGWAGGTEGKGCASALRGASHATSTVELSAEGLNSWDQGFNAAGEQVWGATAGAYRFVRRSGPPAFPGR